MVKLLDRSTDWLTIAADVTQPTLLLITDAYSKYWRATGLRGSIQSKYEVMPADYALMAIPLASGHHLIRMEYAPSGWVIGRWISLGALIAYLFAVIGFAVASRSRRAEGEATAAEGEG